MSYNGGKKEIVVDVRSTESKYSLDANGFKYVKHKSQLSSKDFELRLRIQSVYLPECERLIRREMNDVDLVHFFNWRASST